MAKDLSDYELARLERIKENQQKLLELFPQGTSLTPTTRERKSRPVRRSVRKRSDDDDSRDSGESATEGESGSTGKRESYTVRRELVTPRRNPTRQARPSTGERPLTRSQRRSIGIDLADGLEDDQEVKREVYRTYRRRVTTDEDDLPVELDGEPGMDKRLIKTVERSTDKVYDRVRGATCHQCRQKTIDTKTICHNKNCKGTRGQFCGPCLLNRYGENICDALTDPKWVCPPCRKICNCSFCMPKRGKAPTGIMIHIARECGYDNVHEYLDKSNNY